MTDPETFEFAAAVAGVSIGLTAILLLSAASIIGTWRLFRHANEASLAASRASLSVEELARRVAITSPAAAPTDGPQFAELRQQAAALIDEQQRLQEVTRNLLDTAAVEGAPTPVALDELESTVSRLDGTVGQMAASLADLIQLLEHEEHP